MITKTDMDLYTYTRPLQGKTHFWSSFMRGLRDPGEVKRNPDAPIGYLPSPMAPSMAPQRRRPRAGDDANDAWGGMLDEVMPPGSRIRQLYDRHRGGYDPLGSRGRHDGGAGDTGAYGGGGGGGGGGDGGAGGGYGGYGSPGVGSTLGGRPYRPVSAEFAVVKKPLYVTSFLRRTARPGTYYY